MRQPYFSPFVCQHYACALMGVTLLPDFVARDMDGLVALSAPIDALQTPVWILTHPDLRNTARVRAFMQIVGDALARELA